MHTHTHTHTGLAPTRCLIKYTLMRYKSISTRSIPLFMWTHTHGFTNWGHWIISEMKGKKKRVSAYTDSHFNYLYSSGCLDAVSWRLRAQLTTVSSGTLSRGASFAIWFPSTQESMISSLWARNRCVSIPPGSSSFLSYYIKLQILWTMKDFWQTPRYTCDAKTNNGSQPSQLHGITGLCIVIW